MTQTYRILVVEDNPADVYLLRMALERAGIECAVTHIDDGEKALQYIQTTPVDAPKPDLAILDLNLPSHGGIEILTAIRQSAHWKDLPVAVITSSSAAAERRHAETLGVVRFITKPPDLSEFLRIGDVLREVLAKGRSNA